MSAEKLLWKRYNEASFNGTMDELIRELSLKEKFQLYAITGNEKIGKEIDRIKGKGE